MKPVPGAFGKDGEPVRIEEREEPVAEDPAAEEGPSEDAC